MVSVGRILEGAFGLIRERFTAVAIWAGIYLIGNVAMLLTMQPIMASALSPGAAATDPAAMIGMMAPVYALNLILALVGVVLYTAAMRAVLQPRAGGIAFLRLGMDELRMLLLLLLFSSGGFVLAVGCTLILGLFGAGMAMTSDSPILTALLGFLVGVVVFGVFLFLLIRFSLAFPLTLHRSRIVIGEAWTLSRGRFWTLFGAAFIIVVIGSALMMVIGVFAFSTYFADIMAAAGDPRATAAAAERQIAGVGALGPMMLVQTFAGAAIAGLWIALSGGSAATAAKLLLDTEFDDAEEVFG